MPLKRKYITTLKYKIRVCFGISDITCFSGSLVKYSEYSACIGIKKGAWKNRGSVCVTLKLIKDKRYREST